MKELTVQQRQVFMALSEIIVETGENLHCIADILSELDLPSRDTVILRDNLLADSESLEDIASYLREIADVWQLCPDKNLQKIVTNVRNIFYITDKAFS